MGDLIDRDEAIKAALAFTSLKREMTHALLSLPARVTVPPASSEGRFRKLVELVRDDLDFVLQFFVEDVSAIDEPVRLASAPDAEALDSVVPALIGLRQLIESALEYREAPQASRRADRPECPTCKAEMRLRMGKSGRFWGCTRYPECRGTRPVVIKTDPDGPRELIRDLVGLANDGTETPEQKRQREASRQKTKDAGAQKLRALYGRLLQRKNTTEAR